ncbi:MAG: hypothetical protein LBE34_08220 [Flavobacteriaceae bacterium]|nr:hypothetical protein [Flavobacteriaceae bacterium]
MRALLISFCALLLFSCKSFQVEQLPKEAYRIKDTTVENTYFATVGQEHLFRANITVFKRELSGLLVVKRINDSLHRVVLTSDFGNTLFDFSIYKDHHEVNYVMTDLDRKLILNILAKDFSYLTETNYAMQTMADIDDKIVYQGIYKSNRTVVVYNKQQQRVSQVIYASRKKAKVYYNYNLDGKGTLAIEHHNFPMTIKLTPIQE